jgi:NAD(P)-dependent dehydrogenase (short-subunit alcohol dehydrogenase family)
MTSTFSTALPEPETTPFSLTGQVILVTGATGILGEAFCRAIGAAGGTVVLLGRNEAVGRTRQAALLEAGIEACFLPVDVLSQPDLDRVADEVLTRYGRIDGLVNGAGGNVPEAVVQPNQDVFSVDINALKRAFDLNLYGTILPTLTFGRHIAEAGGSIVNISSMAAQQAITRVLGYSMAKAAVDNFTRWMAVELANRYADRVRINALAPGFFVTEQNRHLLTTPTGGHTARGEAVIRNTPYARFGHPDELTGTLVWLLSGASRFVTGQIISVDGGFSVFSGV